MVTHYAEKGQTGNCFTKRISLAAHFFLNISIFGKISYYISPHRVQE
jgi:hypothetical protein